MFYLVVCHSQFVLEQLRCWNQHSKIGNKNVNISKCVLTWCVEKLITIFKNRYDTIRNFKIIYNSKCII